MRCPSCGVELVDGATSCLYCGRRIAGSVASGTGSDARAGAPAEPAAPATEGAPPIPVAPPPGTPGSGPWPAAEAYPPPAGGYPPVYGVAVPPSGYLSPPGYPVAPMAVAAVPARRRWWLIASIALVVVLVVGGALGGVLLLRSRGGASSASKSSPLDGMKPIFQSPLTSSDTRLPSVPPDCQAEGDGFHTTNGYFCYIRTISGELTDGAVAVDVRLLSGSNATPLDVIVRSPNGSNYYQFSIDETQHWFAGKSVSGTWTLLRRGASTAIRLLDTNTLVVRFVGPHFTFYVNGTKLVELDDSSLDSGEIGLGCGPRAEAVFTNLTIATPR